MLFTFAWHAPDSGAKSPYRLVVRTSRCGRDNPGSTPGEDILPTRMHSSCTLSLRMPAHALFYKSCVMISSTPPAVPFADHLATCRLSSKLLRNTGRSIWRPAETVLEAASNCLSIWRLAETVLEAASNSQELEAPA